MFAGQSVHASGPVVGLNLPTVHPEHLSQSLKGKIALSDLERRPLTFLRFRKLLLLLVP